MKSDMNGYGNKKDLPVAENTITISAEEYYALQYVADIMRRDYIAVNAEPGTQAAQDALLATATAAEWKAAVEALDA
jgi:hypothetical protein